MAYKPQVLEVAAGGTGANLSDPNADRILFWDDSAGAVDWLTAGTGLSISGTTLTSTASGGITWSVVTVDASFTVNTGVIANKSGLLTMTLPGTSAVGDQLAITGINTALGWKIAQNANQIIHYGERDTTTGAGGSLASTLTRDTVFLVCVVANLEWNVISGVGDVTVV